MLTIINCETDQTEINNLNQRIDALTIANNNLRAQISTLTGTTTTITGDSIIVISGNTATINALQNQINQLQNTLSGANATNTTATTTIRNLQNRLNALSGASAEQIMTLQNQINNSLRFYDINSLQTANYISRTDTEHGISGSGDSAAPFGIWSDGETMWVVNTSDIQIYAFNLRADTRDADKDFTTDMLLSGATLSGITTYMTSMWSDGSIAWVLDSATRRIYAYNLDTKARVPNQDFNTLSGGGSNGHHAIWSDGTTMWVSDRVNHKIWAYNLDTKARVPSQEFNMISDAGNTDPTGIWSDGVIMWILDFQMFKVYAYNLDTKERVPSRDINTLLSVDPLRAAQGIWSDGVIVWVGNFYDRILYAYLLPR